MANNFTAHFRGKDNNDFTFVIQIKRFILLFFKDCFFFKFDREVGGGVGKQAPHREDSPMLG